MATGNAAPKGYIVPNPGPPKMIGILNVVFASMILLCGICQGVGSLAGPAILKWAFAQQQQQEARSLASHEAMIQEEVAKLDALAKTAKSEEEKANIAAKRQYWKTRPKPYIPNVTSSLEIMRDRRIVWFNWFYLITGILVNLAMLLSGIWLISLKERGRRLALGTFWVKIARLAVLGAWSILVIAPLTVQSQRKEFDKITAQIQAQQGNNANTSAAMKALQFISGIMGVFTAMIYVGMYGGGMVYPVIGLVVLTRPRARIACLVASKRLGTQDELT